MSLHHSSGYLSGAVVDPPGWNPNKDNIAIHLVGSGQTQTLKQYVESSADLIRNRVRRHGSVDLIWACCRSVKFKGKHLKLSDEAGANAIDLFTDREYKLRYKKRGADSEVMKSAAIGKKELLATC